MRSSCLIRPLKENKGNEKQKKTAVQRDLGPFATCHLILIAKWKREGLCTCLGVFPALFNKSRGIRLLDYKLVSSWTFLCLAYCSLRKRAHSALCQVHVSAMEFLLIIITKFALTCGKKYWIEKPQTCQK